MASWTGMVLDFSARPPRPRSDRSRSLLRHADRLHGLQPFAGEHEGKIGGSGQIVRDASEFHALTPLVFDEMLLPDQRTSQPRPSSVRPRGLYSAPIQPSYPRCSSARQSADSRFRPHPVLRGWARRRSGHARSTRVCLEAPGQIALHDLRVIAVEHDLHIGAAAPAR